MKKYIIVLLFIFTNSLFLPLKAEDMNKIIEQANILYKEKAFEKAIINYEKVLSKGYEAAELYYNTGNAYYRSGNYVKAILNYERAKKLNPDNEDIDFNLKLANRNVVDKIEKIPPFFLTKWYANFASSLHPDSWAILSVLSFILLLLTVSGFLLTGKSNVKKLTFLAAVIFLFLSISSLSLAYRQKNELYVKKEAILISPSITVKSSPGGGTNLFVLHEGTKVKVLETNEEWSEIKIDDGKVGWIRNEEMEVI